MIVWLKNLYLGKWLTSKLECDYHIVRSSWLNGRFFRHRYFNLMQSMTSKFTHRKKRWEIKDILSEGNVAGFYWFGLNLNIVSALGTNSRKGYVMCDLIIINNKQIMNLKISMLTNSVGFKQRAETQRKVWA